MRRGCISVWELNTCPVCLRISCVFSSRVDRAVRNNLVCGNISVVIELAYINLPCIRKNASPVFTHDPPSYKLGERRGIRLRLSRAYS